MSRCTWKTKSYSSPVLVAASAVKAHRCSMTANLVPIDLGMDALEAQANQRSLAVLLDHSSPPRSNSSGSGKLSPSISRIQGSLNPQGQRLRLYRGTSS